MTNGSLSKSFIASIIALVLGSVLGITIEMYDNYLISEFEKSIKKHLGVKDANVLEGNMDWGEAFCVRVLITFDNGDWILLRDVYKDEEVIKIGACNGYSFFVYERRPISGAYSASFLYTGELNEILDIKLHNLDDIIMNKDIICSYMNSLDDIDSDKFKSYDKQKEWIWNAKENVTIKHVNNTDYCVFKKKVETYMLEDHL